MIEPLRSACAVAWAAWLCLDKLEIQAKALRS